MTDITAEQCADNLAKLRQAKFDLLTGAMKTEVRYADKSVKYAMTDIDKLEQAIRDTEAQCAALNAGVTHARRHGYIRPGI